MLTDTHIQADALNSWLSYPHRRRSVHLELMALGMARKNFLMAAKGTQCPILHAEKDQACPIRFAGDPCVWN
jgi:hypothetical protein